MGTVKEKRAYEDICRDVRNAETGKEYRKLHRELRQYGHRLPLFARYPNMGLVVSIIVLVIVLADIFLSDMH